MAMASGRKITLRSFDGETFEVDEVVAAQSQTIKFMVEEDCANSAIPLPNVSGQTLSKVIEYCKKHAVSDDKQDKTASADENLRQWDQEFIKVDQSILYDILTAANFLDIKSLLELSCQRVADMIKGKTPDEIRKTFNIQNDFTPEEEEQMRKDYQWAID